jgi:hypothetical protein
VTVLLLLLQVVLPPPQHLEGGFTFRVQGGIAVDIPSSNRSLETGFGGAGEVGYRWHSQKVGVTPEMALSFSGWKSTAGFVLYPGSTGQSSDDVSVFQWLWGFRLDLVVSPNWALWEANHFGLSIYNRHGACRPDIDACRNEHTGGGGVTAGVEYRWMGVVIGPFVGFFIDGGGPMSFVNFGLGFGFGAF